MQAPIKEEIQQTIRLINVEESQDLFGPRDENLRLIQSQVGARVVARGDLIAVSGDPEEVAQVITLFEELLKLVRQGDRVTHRDVDYLLHHRKERSAPPIGDVFAPVNFTLRGRKGLIKPKSPGQRIYLQAIESNDIVFGIGPAGTGKTYLAVAAAVNALERDRKSVV